MLLLLPSLAEGTPAGKRAAIVRDADGVEEQRALEGCTAFLAHLRSVGLLEGSRAEGPPPEAKAAAPQVCQSQTRLAAPSRRKLKGEIC
jgi:hypothetical protein